jgi:hypothetical protein
MREEEMKPVDENGNPLENSLLSSPHDLLLKLKPEFTFEMLTSGLANAGYAKQEPTIIPAHLVTEDTILDESAGHQTTAGLYPDDSLYLENDLLEGTVNLSPAETRRLYEVLHQRFK